MKRFLVFAFLSVVLLQSCRWFNHQRVKGDGSVTTQTRNVTDFKGVKVGGAIDLYLKQDAAYAVKIETDNNLMGFIEVYKEGNTLHIHPKNGVDLDASGKIKVYVSAPSFDEIGASGACNVMTENRVGSDTDLEIDLSGACEVSLDVKAPSVSVDASGASSVQLKGETKDLEIDGSGSTNVKAFELKTENAIIELSGAGDAEIFASVQLTANASGASSIRYKGNAAVNSSSSGAGSIKKVN